MRHRREDVDVYEVFNYLTGETVGYVEHEHRAFFLVRKAWRNGLPLDYLPADETCGQFVPDFS